MLEAVCLLIGSLAPVAPPSQDSAPASQSELRAEPREIAFPSGDGLEITADVYRGEGDEERPLIVLFHQAGWSRGEYREIAPRLVELGFDCLAVDLRSGKGIRDVPNETARRAVATGRETSYLDALPDVVAALRHAREELSPAAVIAWGSSYSAALVIKVAGDHPELVDAVLAFAPGEYFLRLGKTEDWVRNSAAKIGCPAFVTSARAEQDAWRAMFDAIPTEDKVSYVPESAGNHGSRALWAEFDDNAGYWKAVEAFLAGLPLAQPAGE